MAEFLCRRRYEWIAFFLFAAIVSYQLFVPPVVGLANNGDFAKVLGIFDLAAPVENEYKFLSTTYSFDPKHHSWFGFISSEHLLAAAAILLNVPFSKDGALDIRVVGVAHAALYLFAFYLLLPLLRGLSAISRAALCGLLLLIFGDVMYVSWLNTFYMDTAALLFLMLSAVLYLRWLLWKKRADQIAFVAAGGVVRWSEVAALRPGSAAGLRVMDERLHTRQVSFPRPQLSAHPGGWSSHMVYRPRLLRSYRDVQRHLL